MRRSLTALPLLAFIAFALSNCSSDSPTHPPIPTGDEVLAEATVDAAGDTLSADAWRSRSPPALWSTPTS